MAREAEKTDNRATPSRGVLLAALAISLVSHVALVTVVTAVSLLSHRSPADPMAPQIAAVQIQRIPATRWQANRLVRGEITGRTSTTAHPAGRAG